MKVDYKPTIEDSALSVDEGVSDPFAVDLFSDRSFGAGTAAATAADTGTVSSDEVSWITHLPRVTATELQASAAIAALPTWFYRDLEQASTNILSRFSNTPADQIVFHLVDVRETDLSADLSGGDAVYLSFTSEPGNTVLTLALDPHFCVMIIDRVLGGAGEPPNSLRSLTTAELAVVEFLCLNLTNEVNRQLAEPLLRLRSVSELPPRVRATSASRGLVVSLRVDLGNTTGVVHASLSGESLPQLDTAQRSLLNEEDQARRYADVVPDVSLSVLVGNTDLALEDFAQLEPGDVMALERQSLRRRAGAFVGPIVVRVGAGEESLITGELINEGSRISPRDEFATSVCLQLRVNSLKFEAASRFAGRSPMPEEIEPAEPTGEANQIDNVMLTVRVELAARRLRLDELVRLRTNQILDLGCNPTDPVDLLVDERRVARGELVDLEGRLGVRITQVLG